jgi:hypothetical protein
LTSVSNGSYTITAGTTGGTSPTNTPIPTATPASGVGGGGTNPTATPTSTVQLPVSANTTPTILLIAGGLTLTLFGMSIFRMQKAGIRKS